MSTMTLNDRKDLFSRAYVRAVASVAGFSASVPELDRDSVDLHLAGAGGGGTVKSPYLDVQLKCTERDFALGESFSLALKLKNYNDLRGLDFAVPRILVVVLVPANTNHWFDANDERTVLQHCAYWHSLRNAPATDNTTSVSVSIESQKRFDVAALSSLMATVASGGAP
jgi:hypothetical protein